MFHIQSLFEGFGWGLIVEIFFLLLLAFLLQVPGWLFSRRWGISPYILLSSFVFLVVIGSLVNLPSSPFLIVSDGLHYQAQAINVSEWFHSGMKGELLLDRWKEAWPLLIGGIYFITGPIALVGILINSAVICFTILIIIRTTQLLSNKNPGWLIALLFLISPMVLTMGPSLGRESFYWLGAALLSISGVYLLLEKYFTFLITLILGISSLILIRPSLGLVVIYLFLFPVFSIYIFHKYKKLLTRITLIFVTFSVLLVSIPYTFSPFTTYVDNVSITREALIQTASTGFIVEIPNSEETNNELNNSTLDNSLANSVPREGNTIPREDKTITSVISNLKTGLFSLPNILFGPFPNEIELSITWLYLIFSTLVWLVIALSALLQMWRERKHKFMFIAFQLFAVCGYLFVLSITMTNYGIVARFRILAEVILLPWSAIYLSYISPAKISSWFRGVRKIKPIN